MNFELAFLLLSVAEKALGFPKLKPVHDAALAELEKLAQGAATALGAEPIPPPEGLYAQPDEDVERRV